MLLKLSNLTPLTLLMLKLRQLMKLKSFGPVGRKYLLT